MYIRQRSNYKCTVKVVFGVATCYCSQGQTNCQGIWTGQAPFHTQQKQQNRNLGHILFIVTSAQLRSRFDVWLALKASLQTFQHVLHATSKDGC
jgi:hypothetical protein